LSLRFGSRFLGYGCWVSLGVAFSFFSVRSGAYGGGLPDRCRSFVFCRRLLFFCSDMSSFFSSFVLYVVSVSATGKWWWCCGVAGGGAAFFGSLFVFVLSVFLSVRFCSFFSVRFCFCSLLFRFFSVRFCSVFVMFHCSAFLFRF
jgi:hypothetical protein